MSEFDKSVRVFRQLKKRLDPDVEYSIREIGEMIDRDLQYMYRLRSRHGILPKGRKAKGTRLLLFRAEAVAQFLDWYLYEFDRRETLEIDLDSGEYMTIGDICAELDLTQTTIYYWRTRYPAFQPDGYVLLAEGGRPQAMYSRRRFDEFKAFRAKTFAGDKRSKAET